MYDEKSFFQQEKTLLELYRKRAGSQSKIKQDRNCYKLKIERTRQPRSSSQVHY